MDNIQFCKKRVLQVSACMLISVFLISCQSNGLLMQAILENDLDKVRKILKTGVDINSKNSVGETYIHLAASAATPDILNEFRIHGSKIDAVGYFGQTPLHRAAGSGKLANIKWLVDNGVSPSARCKFGTTFLHRATASHKPNTEVISWILENTTIDIDDLSNDMQTPLMLSAEHGHIENVRYLIEHGANTQLRNEKKLMAVDIAKLKERQDVVQLFSEE